MPVSALQPPPDISARLGPVRRVVVLNAEDVHSGICLLPALQALRSCFPEAEMALIARGWGADLLGRVASLDRFEPLPAFTGRDRASREGAAADLSGRFRGEPIDLALQMGDDGRFSNRVVGGLGARVSLGYSVGLDSRLTDSLPWLPREHAARRWLRLVWVLRPAPDLGPVVFPVSAEEGRRADLLLSDAPLAQGRPRIQLHLGAKHPSQQLPARRAALLAAALAERWGGVVVLTGDHEDRERAVEIERTRPLPMLDLAGRTDLGLLAAITARCDLVVCVDSVAQHLAAAVDVPCVAIHSGPHPDEWSPLDARRSTPIDARAVTGVYDDPAAAMATLPIDAVLFACDRRLREAGFRAAACVSGADVERGGGSAFRWLRALARPG